MRYGSVCSGIEAATVAWHPLGWEPAWFCEIDAFPSAVLRHHYPEVPNHGDFTKLERPAAIDLLVGGTPCQDFSVAGLRAGIDGERGQLTLEFLRLVQRTQPRWLVWENVPGVLSANGGRAFGAFVGGLAECGYGFAWRVLDAQYVRVDGYPGAVPQRRRRIFVVGCAGGDWLRAGSVLLEPEGVRGNLAPRREAGKGAPAAARRGLAAGSGGLGDRDGGAGGGIGGSGGSGGSDDGGVVCARESGQGYWMEDGISDTLRTDSNRNGKEGTILGTLVRPVAGTLNANYGKGPGERGGAEREYLAEMAADAASYGRFWNGAEVAETLTCTSDDQRMPDKNRMQVVLQGTAGFYGDKTGPLDTDGHSVGVHVEHRVRRLTPVECERLQGFPDDYTRIPWRGKPAEDCPDGPRYRALGNSMACNVMRWIGRRIEMVEART